MLAALARDHYSDFMKGMLTVIDTARMLGVSPRRVRALVQDKRLPAMFWGRCWYLRREDVLTFRTKPRPTGRPPKNPKPRKLDRRLA